jgi:MYXO-CTERM domain-containing protein
VLGLLIGTAVFVASTSDAQAYAVKRTSHGDLVHWEERTVSYTIDPSIDANVTRGNEATLRSMDSWSGTVGAPDLQTIPSDASSPKKPGFDQKNGVFYINGGYVPAGRALAITVLTYDNASGRILDADVIVNGSYSFEVLNAPEDLMKERETSTHPSAATDGLGHDEETERLESVYDLHHVIAHELGHSLGMNDEMGRKDALMYRYSAPNDATMRQPASDDIAGLAELYSTKLEGAGNGCGSATVAPKPPSRPASHAAMFATLGLLLFLVLRARSDRRARAGFVFAAAAATIAFMPTLSGKSGPGVARASESMLNASVGHARAKVLGTSTVIENGLFKTQYKLATTACRASTCPKAGHGEAWGGTIGNITQEVGGYYAPSSGDEVDVSFTALPPSALTTLSRPLAGRPVDVDTTVRVLTRSLARDL